MKTDPSNILVGAANTFRLKSGEYGKLYDRIGPVMEAMMPDGVHLKTADDFARFNHALFILTKTMRYMENISKGGHKDSARDIQVYAAILESITE